MTRDEAEFLAIRALQHLAGEPGEFSRFLALTGLSLPELREAAQSPEFLSGLLDYFLGDEPSLIAFAAAQGVDPHSVAKARIALSHSNERS
jgi:hypothetical protein